jgi:hypothetical protein
MLISDITEGTRCWKGYKKKGMKTMFGKRVPNCVKNEDVTKGNWGGVVYPQLPHQEVLDAISSWEYRDTPIKLSNGYVINAREEGYNDDDNALVLLDPQGKEVNHGEDSIEGLMQGFTPKAIEENFAKPQFDVEWGEAERYPFLAKLGKEGWIELANTGKTVIVNKDNVGQIGNTGADGGETFDDLDPDKVGRFKSAIARGVVEMPIIMKMPNGQLELVAGNTRLIGLMNKEGNAKVWYIDASKLNESEDWDEGNWEYFMQQLKASGWPRKRPNADVDGKLVDLLNDPKAGKEHKEQIRQYFSFLGGFDIAIPGDVIDQEQLGKVTVLKIIDKDMYNMPAEYLVKTQKGSQLPITFDELVLGNEYGSETDIGGSKLMNSVDENFADGKKKGKSRPGRVKRAGASCKGSVSSLRAKAKKYSGERGKMYHWCANMKGGKKK